MANYIVKSGDTINSLCKDYLNAHGLDGNDSRVLSSLVNKVADVSGVENANRIYPGDNLWFPDGESELIALLGPSLDKSTRKQAQRFGSKAPSVYNPTSTEIQDAKKQVGTLLEDAKSALEAGDQETAQFAYESALGYISTFDGYGIELVSDTSGIQAFTGEIYGAKDQEVPVKDTMKVMTIAEFTQQQVDRANVDGWHKVASEESKAKAKELVALMSESLDPDEILAYASELDVLGYEVDVRDQLFAAYQVQIEKLLASRDISGAELVTATLDHEYLSGSDIQLLINQVQEKVLSNKEVIVAFSK
jgi:hypothetical protein